MSSLEHYDNENTCHYKMEYYSVRDNGSVMRFSIDGKRLRPTDNKWTYGKLNIKTGYLEIASVSIHRIVATSFHGEPPTKEHVVDHIDTNKQNNRPNNLRWVTRLENILLNPITARRIELVCGSVEEFLEDPSKFRERFKEPNLKWMCTVNQKEAHISKQRLLLWAKSEKMPSGGSIGEWIFNRNSHQSANEQFPELITSLTSKVVQKNWKTPTEFPCCPKSEDKVSIFAYAVNLKSEKIFSRNQYSCLIVEDFAFSPDENALLVMCRNSDIDAIKPYSLVEITVEKDNYIHNNLGSFFQKQGAQKQFFLKQGLDWKGGETFDDFC